ncbi:class I SAM-dependent methyltransferase [Ferruginibacter sp.]|uniref:class I SAM-dependent methyltransferase n=1 Tax=Ferruginibacter sp. TaxID=1940288 RepID=UPI00198507F6|nr:class I SAM-dependent methyltransferase [Ferruginibacter sp.]MBC7627950.1 class I SAM-dependent methyltransferase [Ferruginibacter sp.]
MNCKICNKQSLILFEALVLKKHLVKYLKCQNCGFIQTEEPYWLNDAYASPIALLDVGLLYRNNMLAERSSPIFNQIAGNGKYLDYGGGYGIYVRLMRDRGYDFYLSDKYCKNLFAQFFELKDAGIENGFTCLTAFEVFEHLASPIDEITAMFHLSDTIFFSTELQPEIEMRSVNDWWYFVPEAGQHIALFSIGSLEQLKLHFNCYLYSNNVNLHILSKKPLLKDPFESKVETPLTLHERIFNKFFKPNHFIKQEEKKSLLQKDFEYYKTKLFNGNA